MEWTSRSGKDKAGNNYLAKKSWRVSLHTGASQPLLSSNPTITFLFPPMEGKQNFYLLDCLNGWDPIWGSRANRQEGPHKWSKNGTTVFPLFSHQGIFPGRLHRFPSRQREGRRDRQCYQKGDIKTLAALPWAGGVRKEKQVMQNGEE